MQSKHLYIFIILAMVCYAIFTLWAGVEGTFEEIKKINLLIVFYALSLSSINYLIRFMRWTLYLSQTESSIPLWSNIRIYISGFALTATPGKVGEISRGYFLNKYGISFSQSMAYFFSERFADITAVLVIASVSGFYYEYGKNIIVILWVFVAVAILIFRYSHFIRAIESKFEYLKKAHMLFIALAEQVKNTNKKHILILSILMSVFSWSMEGIALFIIANALFIDINIIQAMFVFSISVLIGAISFLPGGIGSAEIVMAAVLVSMGANETTAVAATLIFRFTTLWYSVFLGVLALPKKSLTKSTIATD